MNLTLPNPKVGYTDMNGVTNDRNTVPIKFTLPKSGDCACNEIVASGVPCACPSMDDMPTSKAYGRFGLPVPVAAAAVVPATTVATAATDAISTAATTITNTATNLLNQVKAAYAANPYYFYIGGAVVLYLATKKKGHKLF